MTHDNPAFQLSRRQLLGAAATGVLAGAVGQVCVPAAWAATTYPTSLTTSRFAGGFAADGTLRSLKVVGDAFPTEYLLNADSAPTLAAEKAAKHRQWLGSAVFSYAFGTGTVSASGVGGTAWTTATTAESGDVAAVTSTSSSVTVTIKGSKNSGGIRDFTFGQTFEAQSDGSITWSQTVTNTSSSPLVIGDWGIPVPDNEMWNEGDEIYETRVVMHSSVARHNSYVTMQRPSGQGGMVVIATDPSSGAGFEYQDHWRTEEVGTTDWATDNAHYGKGLNVYYVHSSAIQRTGRGYVPSTSTTIAAGASKTYRFTILTVADELALGDALHSLGMVDVSVVPGLVVAYDRPVRIALRTRGSITSVKASTRNDLGGSAPAAPTVSAATTSGQHSLYTLTFTRAHLGQNDVEVTFTDSLGAARTADLRLWVTDSTAALLDAHARFIVTKTQWTAADGLAADDVRLATFDDWMMNASDGSLPTGSTGPRGRRNEFYGYWGLGDDWGLTHGQFLAEKQWSRPVAAEVEALDAYLCVAVWKTLMGNTGDGQASYKVYDFWKEGAPGAANDTPSYRGYAYPHIYNTFFAMYRVAREHPDLVRYTHPATWYLTRAYGVFKELYDGDVSYNWDTGLMGEMTTPWIIEALRTEGMNAEADDVVAKMKKKYSTFSTATYPYGSEYSYDNTGEEAVYMLARLNIDDDRDNALRMMRDIVKKTRASRGHEPFWYYYADPVTNLGESWWQFQYSSALAGASLDDYLTRTAALETGSNALPAARRALLSRLNHAGKTNLFCLVNSGQISSHPDNVGASAWTYQAEKGVLGTNGLGGGRSTRLLNGFRGMTGESDLSLWAALQTLSADVVTDDPVFGVVGYGADVTQDEHSWIIEPKDGLQRRINVISRQVSVRTDTDRIVRAVVPKDITDVTLTMENVSGGSHAGSLQVTGFPAGTWAVLVDGVVQRRVVQPAAQGGQLLPPLRVGWVAPANGQYLLQVVAADAVAGIPSPWVSYSFDTAAGRTVADGSGHGNDLQLRGSAEVGTDGTRTVLRLDGSDGACGQLPEGVLAQATSATISVDVRIEANATWQRILDFGSGTDQYMFLTTAGPDGTMLFAISAAGPQAESQVRTSYAFPLKTWVSVQLSLSPNADGTTTAVLEVDGKEVGRNSSVRTAPSDLGSTTSNYLGRSQFPDPGLVGSLDSFEIRGTA